MDKMMLKMAAGAVLIAIGVGIYAAGLSIPIFTGSYGLDGNLALSWAVMLVGILFVFMGVGPWIPESYVARFNKWCEEQDKDLPENGKKQWYDEDYGLPSDVGAGSYCDSFDQKVRDIKKKME